MELTFGDHPRTEADTVLYLHDYLANRYAYDTRPEAEANADAYTFLRDGVGICQAYALTFLALCQGAGLEADLVVSDAMDHAWNHVRVEGVWYHVDVTRDDPIPNEEGEEEVNHRRFLRSDAGMKALGYHGFSCAAGHACGDTRFESDGEAALDGFSKALTRWGNGWAGVQEGGGVVGVQRTGFGIIVGKSGDVNTDGEVTPADLLWVYDPALPEQWRAWMRGRLVGREG
jgi:transglutaminase-like putative cysteine protease